MPKLEASKRARLPDSAFAYVDSKGNRRLPINDAAHVKNALSRFKQVAFESEVAREKARKRLLNAAKKYGIVPVGFITGQLQSEREFGADHARKAEEEALPTGTVTLMMTDIEGSTNLVHDLGDAYGELLDDIRGLVRGTLSSRRGHEVDVRADEVFAVFEDAVGAVEAAMSVQRALKVKAWPQGVEVRIRIGVHHGRPTRRGNGYIGIAVHTTARLCAFARGGQIVTSAEVRDAVRGSGIKFRSLGVVTLPGLGDPQPLYQVQINLA